MTRRSRALKITVLVLFFGPLALFIFGMLVMFLWNRALVPVLHISEVTFWQGLGILVLSRILFGGFSGRSGRQRSGWRDRMEQKWNRMSPEERERLKEKWKDHWWKMGFKPWDEKKSNDTQGE